MADTVKNDTVENKEENPTKNEEKVKKDKENEKIKTGTQENADVKDSSKDSKTNKDSKVPEDTATAGQNKEENVKTDVENVKADTENVNVKAENVNAKTENVNANAEHVNAKTENVNANAENVNAKTENVNANAENVNANVEKDKISKEKHTKQDDKKNSKTGAKSGADTKEKPEENTPVNLKLVQGHYKTHTKSTLPHILTEYGLEDKGHPSAKKEKRKRKKKKVEVVSDAEDDERSKRKARDEQFRNVIASTRETDTYYMEYLDFLEQKVIQQRQKAQREKEEAEKLKVLKEEEESEEEVKKAPRAPVVEPERQKRRFVRKLERIELKHDDTFLKSLPKSDTARIINLQDKLKKEGKLKTQNDVDKFWSDIKKPDVFYQHFKVKKKDSGPFEPGQEDDRQSGDQEDAEGPSDPGMAPRSLSHISEASRGDKEPWAITQKFQTSHGPKTPISERKRKDSTQAAREAALDLERRCPKLEMPPLACFSLKFGDKPPDPEEITRKLDLKAREKSRKKFQRKLNKMYQMAMTNTAASNRILAQHGDITNILEGAALRDVLAVFDEPYPTLEDYYRDIADPSRALEVHPDAERRSEGSWSKPSTRQSSAASRKLTPISDTASRASSKSRKKKKPLEMIEYPAPLPLSFDEVTTREKTMEPKCTSTLWTNYMHAGKSVFAQS